MITPCRSLYARVRSAGVSQNGFASKILLAKWLVVGCLVAGGTVSSQAQQTPRNSLRDPAGAVQPKRPSVSASPRATSSPVPRQSLVKLAAQGDLIDDVPTPPLDDAAVDRVRSKDVVRQVGFMEDHGVIDRGGCGCGTAVCDGMACGYEPACGLEAGCGFEPGCGFEACGVPGCSSCGDVTFAHTGGQMPMADGCSRDASCQCRLCGPTSVPIFLPILRINWCRFEFFGGVQAFTGPMNFSDHPGQNNAAVRDGSGSFGFYEGFNEGRSLKNFIGSDLAAQLGLRATQSNLNGAEFTPETRHQVFLTGGLFRRVDYGLQYGAVLDYLNDDWYFSGDLLQIRGEVSWRTGRCHDIGVRYAAGLTDSTSGTRVVGNNGAVQTGTINFEPVDQYRIFYRHTLAGNGSWTGFVGGTDDSDFVMGGDIQLPLRSRLALSTGATYLSPGGGADEHQREQWNVFLGLVYRPGGANGCGPYCRPLFDVADNGTMMVRRN